MSVGILLITHTGIGNALLNVAYKAFGNLPLPITQLPINDEPQLELLITKAAYLIKKLDSGHGVLIATDIYGSTPSTIAKKISELGYQVGVVSGLNLPMLFKIMNYPFLDLEQLIDKALAGGREGIIQMLHQEPQY